MRLLDDVIDELASRQAGSLGRDQLRAAGATSAGLRHRRRGGRLLAGPYPGTYRHPAYRVTWRGKLWALQLWGGNVGYLSHEAAGALYELDACAEGKLAITVPRGTRRRHPSVPMHETTFAIEFPRIRQGLRVTSPEQTIVDLASVLSPADADDALQSALRRRLTTTDRVSALLDGRPGTAVARELVAAAIGRRPRDSRFEGRFIRRARAAGLRLEPQFEVWVDGEQYFLDYADPSRMIAIELDGFETHATRAGFQRDATRNTLLQLAGVSRPALHLGGHPGPARLGDRLHPSRPGRVTEVATFFRRSGARFRVMRRKEEGGGGAATRSRRTRTRRASRGGAGRRRGAPCPSASA